VSIVLPRRNSLIPSQRKSLLKLETSATFGIQLPPKGTNVLLLCFKFVNSVCAMFESSTDGQSNGVVFVLLHGSFKRRKGKCSSDDTVSICVGCEFGIRRHNGALSVVGSLDRVCQLDHVSFDRLISAQIATFQTYQRKAISWEAANLTRTKPFDLLGMCVVHYTIFSLAAAFCESDTMTSMHTDVLLERLLECAESYKSIFHYLTAITIPDGDMSERQKDSKLIATCVALSILLTTRSQKCAGISKVLGVAMVLAGVSESVIEMLNKARVSCSYRAADDILKGTDVAEEIKKVLAACLL
jgi:hypothetical protein